MSLYSTCCSPKILSEVNGSALHLSHSLLAGVGTGQCCVLCVYTYIYERLVTQENKWTDMTVPQQARYLRPRGLALQL